MSDTVTPPGDDGDQGGPSQPTPAPGGPVAGGPPGGPGGGGIPPMLAAIARARMQPPPTQPGMGTQAGAMQKLAMAVDLLQQALPALGTGSQEHGAVLNAIRQLSRHAGSSSPGQGAQQTAIQDMMRNQMRNALLQRIMASQRAGQGGGPTAPGGGGGQPGQSPSIPLPGA